MKPEEIVPIQQVDGSADDQLHIKGFSNIEIGDWNCHSDCGSLHTELSQFADVDRRHDENEHIEFVAHGELVAIVSNSQTAVDCFHSVGLETPLNC